MRYWALGRALHIASYVFFSQVGTLGQFVGLFAAVLLRASAWALFAQRISEIPVVEGPVPPRVVPFASAPEASDVALAEEPVSASDSAPAPDNDGKPEGERERLVWAMERCGWVQAQAARLLKISPRQMGYALQKNGIEVRKI
jgi:Nif-specific regulatory protein